MKANYLVCYDIRDPQRLTRVFKCVKRVGLHIQYSVFHCRLTWNELLELKHELQRIIDERKDDVRLYPLPSDLKVVVMGRGDRIPEGVNFYFG